MAEPKALATGTADKVRKLLEVARERYVELGAVLTEIETLMGGGIGIGVLLKRAEKAFESAYAQRYNGGYVWRYQSDRPNMKRLILSLGIEELEGRFWRYVGNDDPFFTRARHSFGAFVASVNQHAGEGVAPAGLDLEGLDADAAATAKRSRELRG